MSRIDDPIWHLTGPILVARDRIESEAWVVNGRITYRKPEQELHGRDPVDLDGFVLPGLADLHCHIGIGDAGGVVSLEEARAQAITDRDTGVLLIRDAGSLLDTRSLQDRGGQGAGLPRIVRCGRHIARTRRYLIGYADEVEPDALADTCARELQRSDGWVKVVADWIDRDLGDLAPTFEADDFAAAAARVHAAGGHITAHTFAEDTLPMLLDAGFDCLEHASGLNDDTIDRVAAARVPVVTTLVNVGEFTTYAAQGERKFPAYAAHMRALHAARYERTAAAHEAGIQLLLGTDSGGVLGHGIVHDEMAELKKVGLSDVDVLQAACWGPAQFLGADTGTAERKVQPDREVQDHGEQPDWGINTAGCSVQPGSDAAARWNAEPFGLGEGAIADLLVMDQDPRSDVRALKDLSAVLIGGRRVSPGS
ncbi:amidohydrolase family protein [Devriesea agamarum]|uniref:amidohydrolase family protein n=1 Tax=Devriesea agamarum TaxID=472569 RepID=UPI0018D43322|nr:amidohydrolase family protein [Devriesea agamarum]